MPLVVAPRIKIDGMDVVRVGLGPSLSAVTGHHAFLVAQANMQLTLSSLLAYRALRERLVRKAARLRARVAQQEHSIT